MEANVQIFVHRQFNLDNMSNGKIRMFNDRTYTKKLGKSEFSQKILFSSRLSFILRKIVRSRSNCVAKYTSSIVLKVMLISIESRLVTYLL